MEYEVDWIVHCTCCERVYIAQDGHLGCACGNQAFELEDIMCVS